MASSLLTRHESLMDQLLLPSQATNLSASLSQQKKSIVLIGGCFDIIHPGHIAFLQKAKEAGDVLVLLLESDEAVTTRKGEGRPVNTEKIRAQNLLEGTPVDYIISLPFPFENNDYDELVSSIKPAIIATTKGDPYLVHKKRQAEMTGAKVVEVINRLPDHSTTGIINKSL